MKCPTCVENGQRSKVMIGVGTTTLLGWSSYYDEDGNYHLHDPNTHMMPWSCSNGHSGVEMSHSECPHSECDYGKRRRRMRIELIDRVYRLWNRWAFLLRRKRVRYVSLAGKDNHPDHDGLSPETAFATIERAFKDLPPPRWWNRLIARVGTGTYMIEAPVTIPPGVELRGSSGAAEGTHDA